MENKNNTKSIVGIIVLGVLLVLTIAAIAFVMMSTKTIKPSTTKVDTASTEDVEESDSDSSDYDYDSDSESTSTDISSFTSVNATPVSASTTQSGDAEEGDYVIADSNTRALTDEDLADLDADQLSHARNEIYARHGYIFDSEDLQNYFTAKSWYTPLYSSSEFSDDVLSDVEKANAELIKTYEDKLSSGDTDDTDDTEDADEEDDSEDDSADEDE